jgi:choline-sulfatase
VPFVTHVPGTEGGVTDALVANIDVAPTVAELAGVELGAVDGRSLVSLLEGEPFGRARAVLLDWIGDDEVPGWVGVRLHDAVLIRHADGTEELYDLAADPRQRTNLAEVPAAHALRSRAERALARFLAAVGTGG